MTDDSGPKKCGILYIHGAGMPEHQTALTGDPLATIADGLLDHFQEDPFIQGRYRMAARASKVKDRSTEELEFSIFAEGEDQPKYVVRMREVLWKPLAPKQSLSTYLPLLWLWVFAFQSNLQRTQVLNNFHLKKKNQRQEGSNKQLPCQEDKKVREKRYESQMWSRVQLALLGLLVMLVIRGAAEIYKRQTMIEFNAGWLTAEQVANTLLATSFLAAVLLVLLAIQERRDNQADQPHTPLLLSAVALTTAWLSIFLLPPLLLLYYMDRVAKWSIILILAGIILFASLNDWSWIMRLVLLAGMAAAIWGLTRPFQWTAPAFLRSFSRRNMQNGLVKMITTIIVTGAAPWVILIITLLEWSAFLPLIGTNLGQLARAISEAGLWQALKDIYVILTDSSRSAVVRNEVEQAIQKLAEPGDLEAIHILAHSLGTVVAYDTLVQIGRGNGVFIDKETQFEGSLYNKIKSLVTFGSPLNKIRTLARLNNGAVLSGFDSDRFGSNTRLPGDLGKGEFRWLNVYSPQDLVSDALVTYPNPGPKEVERPGVSMVRSVQDVGSTDQNILREVTPRDFTAWSASDIVTAHGIYWIDKGFWNTALEVMGVIYQDQGHNPVQIEQVPETELRDKIVQLLDCAPVQTLLAKPPLHMAQNVAEHLVQIPLLDTLRELGVATETQFYTQADTTPVEILRGLGIVIGNGLNPKIVQKQSVTGLKEAENLT